MAEQDTKSEGTRLFFLDNLKVFIIFLVVVYHVGYVYEGSGMLSSLWIVDDPAKNNLAGLVNLILDMFMMPTMFFISGYFAPVSLRSKQGWSFITSRFKRLMIPW
ncbi:MAG: acyltransferase family protein, partial [bacterium]